MLTRPEGESDSMVGISGRSRVGAARTRWRRTRNASTEELSNPYALASRTEDVGLRLTALGPHHPSDHSPCGALHPSR